MKNRALLLTVFTVIFFLNPQVASSQSQNTLPPLRESKAYRNFLGRPHTELGKITYPIDRFATSKGKVLYAGHLYSAPFSAAIARWYLFYHYRKETAEEWVKSCCYRTLIGGEIIYIKYPDGSFRKGIDVLLGELEALEAVYAANHEQEPAG